MSPYNPISTQLQTQHPQIQHGIARTYLMENLILFYPLTKIKARNEWHFCCPSACACYAIDIAIINPLYLTHLRHYKV